MRLSIVLVSRFLLITLLTNTPTPTPTSTGIIAQTATTSPTSTPTFPTFPTFTPFASATQGEILEQTITPTATVILTPTATLIPFPTVTFIYPQVSPPASLLAIQRPAGSPGFAKSGKTSPWKSLACLAPGVVISFVWLLLAGWLVLTQRRLARMK